MVIKDSQRFRNHLDAVMKGMASPSPVQEESWVCISYMCLCLIFALQIRFQDGRSLGDKNGNLYSSAHRKYLLEKASSYIEPFWTLSPADGRTSRLILPRE